MFATQNWYCAARSDDVLNKPIAKKIVNTEMVLFRDSEGFVKSLAAMCAHRGGNLGSGRCIDGNLECPWHGWRYDGEGNCTHVPSLGPDGKIPGAAKVQAYPVHEAQGFIYVWPNSEAIPDWKPAHHRFLDAKYHVKGACRLQKGNFINTVEGSIDDSHVHIAHRKTIGASTAVALAPIQNVTVDSDNRGVEGFMKWDTAAKRKASRVTQWMNKHLLGVSEDPATHDKSFRAEMTGLVIHRYRKQDEHDFVVYGITTPVDECHNLFFAGFIDTNPSRSLIGNLIYWLGFRSIGPKVFDEDEGVITDAIADRFPGGHPRPISVNADTMGLAFRRMYASHVFAEGGEPAWPAARPN
ncbi:MAG: Rieske 2Fe-2S domain-containing protein [Pseudomonadales bacterium]|nr:Rieske 2Fe-2S domain-containing protein [Pseudomonadales bacterium]